MALVAVALALAACAVLSPGFHSHDELEVWHYVDSAPSPWQWAIPDFRGVHDLFYRPVGFAAFAAQLLLADGNPHGVHLLSCMHHGLNVWLFSRVLRQTSLPPQAALWLAVLPTVVPGIAWAAPVFDRLVMTECLLAALLLVRPGAAPALAATATFVVALLTKEVAVVFPFAAAPFAWHRARSARPALVAMVVLAIGFCVWRLAVGASDADYTHRFDAGAGKTLLRYGAFPFAFGIQAPHQIWGWSWFALLGTTVLALRAVRRDPANALFGAWLFVLPLLLVSTLGRGEAHSALLSSVGLALLCSLAVGRGAIGFVLGACLLAHAAMLAANHHLDARTMADVLAAHRRLPATPSPVGFVAEPGSRAWVLQRFAAFTRHAGVLPRLEDAATASSVPVRLVLRADGRVDAPQ